VARAVERPDGAHPGERYFPALDGIRAVAACMVFVDHYGELPYWGHGVNIFFVLSGFLITGILFDTREAVGRWRSFYVRRALRIFPPYYAFWLLMLMLTPLLQIEWNRVNLMYVWYAGNHIWGLFGGAPEDHLEWVHLLMRTRAGETVALYTGHFWTLCVEEQFYLVWPLVMFAVMDRKRLVKICAWGAGVLFAARVAVTLLAPGHMNLWTHMMPLRGDEFLLGGLAALIMRGEHAKRLLRPAWGIFWGGLAAIAASIYVCCWVLQDGSLGQAQWAFTANVAAFDAAGLGAILLAMRERTWLARGLSWRPLRALGRMSYGFYIYHDIPHCWYIRWAGMLGDRFPALDGDVTQKALVAVGGFACTLAITMASYRWVERPFLRMKNRWGVEKRAAA